MAANFAQDINNIITNWGLDQYVNGINPNPIVAKNSIGSTKNLVKNLNTILRRLAGQATGDDKTSRFKIFVNPGGSSDTKNTIASSKTRIAELLSQGYVYFAPLNYFVLPQDLSTLLSAHARKAKAIDIRSWLIGLLSQVNYQLLNQYANYLILTSSSFNGSIEDSVNTLENIAGGAAIKVSPDEYSMRAIQNIINGVTWVNAGKAPVMKTTYDALHQQDKDRLNVLHPASSRTSKSLEEKLRDKVTEITTAASTNRGFLNTYSIKIGVTNTKGTKGYNVTMNTVDKTPVPEAKRSAKGNIRYTVHLGNVGGNQVYLTVGGDVANDIQLMNSIATNVSGIFSQLPIAINQVKSMPVKERGSSAAAPQYWQSQQQIMADNALDQAEALRRQQANQPLPDIQSFQPPPQPSQPYQPPLQMDLQSQQPQQPYQPPPPVVENPADFGGFVPQNPPQQGEGLSSGSATEFSRAPEGGAPIGNIDFDQPPQVDM